MLGRVGTHIPKTQYFFIWPKTRIQSVCNILYFEPFLMGEALNGYNDRHNERVDHAGIQEFLPGGPGPTARFFFIPYFTVFYHWFISNKTIIFQGFRGVQHFPGGGGGVQHF